LYTEVSAFTALRRLACDILATLAFDNFDFFFRQSVKLVNEFVYLAVGLFELMFMRNDDTQAIFKMLLKLLACLAIFRIMLKTCFSIAISDYSLLGMLNSRLGFWYLQQTCSVLGDVESKGRLTLQEIYLSRYPILQKPSSKIAKLAKDAITINEAKQKEELEFLAWLSDYLGVDLATIQGKTYLEKYYDLEFADFKEILVRNKRRLKQVLSG